jgi:hypothetical protein
MLEKVEIMHYGKPATLAQGKVPENDVCREAGKSMYLAWKAYMNEHEKDEPGLKAVVVFLFEAKVIEVAYFEQTQFMQVIIIVYTPFHFSGSKEASKIWLQNIFKASGAKREWQQGGVAIARQREAAGMRYQGRMRIGSEDFVVNNFRV